MTYHNPVMLMQAVDGLNIKGDGVFVDVTFGGGGHSKEIYRRLTNGGSLYAFDQDEDAASNELNVQEGFKLIKQNFRYLKNYLKFHGALPVDGVLADLGVSSHQFDEGQRGFSIRFDGPLDMRMNQGGELTAEMVLDEYDEASLLQLFRNYGEIRNAGRLVSQIVLERSKTSIKTTGQLVDLVEHLVPGKQKNKYLAQVFQSLRIEVNDELNALKQMLEQSYEVLKPGGRLSVITYHSLEDRIVKNYMKTGNFEGEVVKDFYGNPQLKWKLINRKPIVPTAEEISENNRARSAKLRVVEKI